MIVANHLGENLLPALLAGGAGAVPVFLVTTRLGLRRLWRAVARRARAPGGE